MQKKYLRILFVLILAFLIACSPQQAEDALVEESAAEETNEGVLNPAVTEEKVAEEGYPEPADTDTEVAVEVEETAGESVEAYPEPEDETAMEVVEETDSSSAAETNTSLPRLPGLAQASDVSAPAPAPGLGGGSSPAAESAQLGGGGGVAISGDVMNGALMIDPRLMFEGSEFLIVASYPSAPESLQVIERIRSQATLEQAIQLAVQNGFSLPIYQEQLPLDMISEMKINEDGTFAGIPLVAFSENQQITMMDGSLWLDTTSGSQLAPFDPTRTYDEATLLALANEELEVLNLDFDYSLKANAFGSVMVMPMVEGFKVNQPVMGFFFDYNTSNELFLRSMFMDLYAQNTSIGQYPLLSAEDAWSNLLPGLETGMVQWSFGDGPLSTEPIIENIEGDFEAPQTWFVDAPSIGERAMYGWPTVYNPVGDDSPPRIFMNGTWIQAPAEVGMLIATSPQGVFKLTGSTAADDFGNAVYVANSAVSIPFESQLFLQGVVVREGDNVFVDSEDNGRVQLITPPADLPDGMTVFVDGYQDGSSDDGTPLLDWQYVNEAVDYSTEGVISIEPMPVDGFGFNDETLAQITIDSIELGYGISWPQYAEENGGAAPIQSDYMIPIWIFSGTAGDGTEIQFEIPAVDPAYFQN